MKVFTILKPSGKTRTIYAPEREEKRTLRALVPQLNLLAEELDIYGVQHGFTEARSPLTNAKVHIGYRYTVSFDLQDFFDTVTFTHVSNAIWAAGPAGVKNAFGIPMSCFPDCAARQGLPTSPALANIAASPMDKEIVERFCRNRGRFAEPPCVYSRYADDLTFSCNTRTTVDFLLAEIPKVVVRHGFKLNPAKTHVQCAAAGRRIITGVAVDDKGCYVPRRVRRRLRAGAHQIKVGLTKRTIRRILSTRFRWRRRLPLHLRLTYQVQGLREWAKLKMPKDYEDRKPNAFVAGIKRFAATIKQCTPMKTVAGYFGRKFS